MVLVTPVRSAVPEGQVGVRAAVARRGAHICSHVSTCACPPARLPARQRVRQQLPASSPVMNSLSKEPSCVMTRP